MGLVCTCLVAPKLPSRKARRFRRWLSNRRINVVAVHHELIKQALSSWKRQRLYLSVDTTVVWNCFCIVWVGLVYRGRTVPLAWRVVMHSSSSVRLWTIQRVLRQAARILPDGVAVVLLADRGESRWQTDEVPQGESRVAFPHPHQTLVPVPVPRSVAQSLISASATGTSLLHPSSFSR